MPKGISNKSLLNRARKIRLLILDVDGVMTDGSIILDNDGNEYKAFHVRDGQGIKMLQREGIHVAIITGRNSSVVKRRADELGIKEVYQKCHSKAAAYERLLKKIGVTDEETACIGDDIVDIPLFKRSALPIAVADAAKEAKAESVMVTESRGGRGAVREVTDFILKAKGLWKRILDDYLET